MIMQPKNPKNFLSRIDEAYIECSKVFEYRYPTRIGYWDENLAVQEEKMWLLRNKRKQCKTLTIRLNLMNENLLKPGVLSPPNSYILYGVPIQISTGKRQTTELGVKESILAGLITEKDIDATVNLRHGSPVLASGFKKPCRRNLFTIIDPKGRKKKDERVNFGDDIYIRMYDSGSDDRELYLQAIVPTFDTFGGANEHYAIRLSECVDRYCKFKVIASDLSKRNVYRGDAIPSNYPICLAHTVTNRFLVTEKKFQPTFFGPEREISCYNYRLDNKEVPSNLWELTIEKQKELVKPT